MKRILLLNLVLLAGLAWAISAIGADVPRMTKEELRTMLDNPNVVILDVRTGSSWTESESKIKGAVREDPEKVDAWANKYPKDKTFVLY